MAKTPKIVERIDPKNLPTPGRMVLRRALMDLFWILTPEALRFTEKEVGEGDKKRKVRHSRYIIWIPDAELKSNPEALLCKKLAWALAYAVDSMEHTGVLRDTHWVIAMECFEIEDIEEGKRPIAALKLLTKIDQARASALYTYLWLGALKGQDTARGQLLKLADEAGFNALYLVSINADGGFSGCKDPEAAMRLVRHLSNYPNQAIANALAVVVDKFKLLSPKMRAELAALQRGGGSATIGDALAAQGKAPPKVA